MSPKAEQLKKLTLECYEYLVNDGHTAYEVHLAEAKAQPDSHWERVILTTRNFE